MNMRGGHLRSLDKLFSNLEPAILKSHHKKFDFKIQEGATVTNITCKVEGCEREILVRKWSLCSLHYGRFWRTGKTGGPGTERKPLPHKTCISPGCKRSVLIQIRGLCSLHYGRLQRTGETGEPESRRPPVLQEICMAPECSRKAVGNPGFCQKHLHRWKTHGTTEAPSPQYGTAEERFLERIEPQGDCLVWTGNPDSDYGTLRVEGRGEMAHRYAWERVNGPIPEGLVINHRCWNTKCVKVEHLEVTTNKNNVRYQNKPYRHNTTGVRNVQFDRSNKKYRGAIHHEGERIHIGYFDNLEDAEKAVSAKRKELWGKHAGI